MNTTGLVYLKTYIYFKLLTFRQKFFKCFVVDVITVDTK